MNLRGTHSVHYKHLERVFAISSYNVLSYCSSYPFSFLSFPKIFSQKLSRCEIVPKKSFSFSSLSFTHNFYHSYCYLVHWVFSQNRSEWMIPNNHNRHLTYYHCDYHYHTATNITTTTAATTSLLPFPPPRFPPRMRTSLNGCCQSTAYRL